MATNAHVAARTCCGEEVAALRGGSSPSRAGGRQRQSRPGLSPGCPGPAVRSGRAAAPPPGVAAAPRERPALPPCRASLRESPSRGGRSAGTCGGAELRLWQPCSRLCARCSGSRVRPVSACERRTTARTCRGAGLGAGAACPQESWSHRPWKCWKDASMWRFSGGLVLG